MPAANVLPFETEGERPIDKGIAHEVRVLAENGIETFEVMRGRSGTFVS